MTANLWSHNASRTGFILITLPTLPPAKSEHYLNLDIRYQLTSLTPSNIHRESKITLQRYFSKFEIVSHFCQELVKVINEQTWSHFIAKRQNVIAVAEFFTGIIISITFVSLLKCPYFASTKVLSRSHTKMFHSIKTPVYM